MILVILLAGLGPPLLAMSYFWVGASWKPLRKAIRAAFGWGFLAAFPIAIVGLLMMLSVFSIENDITRGAAFAFLAAAIPEETGKMLVLLLFCMREENNKQPLNAVALAIAVSLGFAAIENVLYVLKASEWQEVAIGRCLISVPMHAVAGATMGFFAARTLESEGSSDLSGVLMLLVPILFHGLFDFPLFCGMFLYGSGGDMAQHAWLYPTMIVTCAIPIFSWILILWWLHGAARALDPAREDEVSNPRSETGGYAARPLAMSREVVSPARLSTRTVDGPALRRGFGRRKAEPSCQ